MKQTVQQMKTCHEQFGMPAWLIYSGDMLHSIVSLAMGSRRHPKRSDLQHAKFVSVLAKLGSIAVALSLTACAPQQLDQFNKDLAKFNQAMAAGTTSANQPAGAPVLLAQNTEAGKGVQTQLIVPSDKTAAAALDAVLPIAKKVIGLHQCMKDYSATRLFSVYTIPGNENKVFTGYQYAPIVVTQYHDKNKCVSVRSIDQVTLLALNTLQFRVVYLAEDSGEASNYRMQFVKTDDASWKLLQIRSLD